MAIEQDDPCERARQLRAIRDDIVIGNKATETEIQQGNGVRRRVRFSQANIGALNQLIADAENACALKSGKPKRFAIVPR